ncbi:MAG: hypothetical protein J0L57_18975 [Burkholderiales bacterium]|nr:hypothetical protein [Burkholderiales bacterium]
MPLLADVLAPMREPLEEIWRSRDAAADPLAEGERLAHALQAPIAQALREGLARLYPQVPALDGADPSG